MAKTVYLGKPTNYAGKKVFEILANLKHFGVGRIIVSNSEVKKFPDEPCYYVVKEVTPQMDDQMNWGHCYCDHIYRGKKVPFIVDIVNTHVPDYALIAKEDEHQITRGIKDPEVLGEKPNLLPQYYKVPPLMAEFLNRRRLIAEGTFDYTYDKESVIDFKIPYTYYGPPYFMIGNRPADESKGEEPNVKLEKFVTPRLFKNVKKV